MEESSVFIIVFLLCLVTGIILIILGIFRINKWKRLVETPTSKIADLHMGLVEVDGIIRPIPGKEMRSPLANTPCISYIVEVQEWENRDKDDPGGWRTIHREKHDGPFLVEDDTGLVKIDPSGVKINSIAVIEDNQSLFSDLNSRSKKFLESRDISEKGFFGILKRKIRLKESIVPVDKHIFAMGTARIIVMDEMLEKDPRVSVFTIRNEGNMILSYQSEMEVSASMKGMGIVLLVLGGVVICSGIIALFFI